MINELKVQRKIKEQLDNIDFGLISQYNIDAINEIKKINEESLEALEKQDRVLSNLWD